MKEGLIQKMMDMQIDIKDVLTLEDDSDYVVVSKIDYEGITYLYLVSLSDNDSKIYKLKYDGVCEVTDANMIRILVPMLYQKASQTITE